MGGASLMSGNSLRWDLFCWFMLLIGIIFSDRLVSRTRKPKEGGTSLCSEKKVFSRSPSLSSTPTQPTRSTLVPSCTGALVPSQTYLGTLLHGYLGAYPDLPIRPKPASAYKLFLVDLQRPPEGFLFGGAMLLKSSRPPCCCSVQCWWQLQLHQTPCV